MHHILFGWYRQCVDYLSVHSQHLRSVEIRGNVEVGEKKANKKNIFKFYLSNADGQYVFQVKKEDISYLVV